MGCVNGIHICLLGLSKGIEIAQTRCIRYGSLSLIEKGKTKLGRIGLVRFT